STFSVDVDRAAYANIRRFLNQNTMPYPDVVRVEEMINYFDYDYPQPDGNHPFSTSLELGVCPWNKDHKLLLVGIQGEKMESENIPPANLVFLIDVSGSMNSSNKLPLLKQSFKILVDQLRSEDRVAIVVYAGAAGCVLESTPGSEKAKILAALDLLEAGGSTAGGAGIKLAYKIAKENFIKNGNNRVILASDGDFNVGESSDAAMERLIEEKRKEGVFLTILGFGMGNYKDSKMEKLSNKGNGNYAYIDNILEAKKMFVDELWGTLYTIAKDVKIQIEFNPAYVKGYRLVGYENRLLNKEDFNDDTKDAGEIGSGHSVTALYEIIPADSDETVGDVDELNYQKLNIKKSNDLMTLKLRYKHPNEDTSSLIENKIGISSFGKISDNFNLAASIAQFGMLLRDSEFKGDASYESTLALAKSAKGKDEFGYRNEYITLIEKAALLCK
ncbi:MAG TPA: VWA domain-containing protein, partial [Bacteroidales bacterium]|nr:VWA domain-containing protein [Bacteroidales bacterium]